MTPNPSSKIQSHWKRGDYFVWMVGGALVVCIFMILSLVGIILINGSTFFWPKDVTLFQMKDGRKLLAIHRQSEVIPPAQAREQNLVSNPHRQMVMVGNRDFYSQDFVWINNADIQSQSKPTDVWVMERQEYGNFIGYIKSLTWNKKVLEGKELKKHLDQSLADARSISKSIQIIEKQQIGAVNTVIEKNRLARIRAEKTLKGPELETTLKKLETDTAKHQATYNELLIKVNELRSKGTESKILLQEIDGQTKELSLLGIISAWQPNTMGMSGKLRHYFSHLAEFIWDDPREANTEGGIFPAIFGTALMVILMSIAVVPFGVLTAFYLSEYAAQGTFVNAVRIALNNLAGVPSIVYGVFGLGFFIYFVGGNIDRFFYSEALPNPTWGTGGILWASLTLALMTVPVVVMATEESIASVPRGMREGSLALGASKFQTLKNILLPASLPGILTGVILAMARGAGEVAPLMITGVVKLAPSLPLDSTFPYMHLERKFMHLGFHIYDVGFQSPNIEAARPMVFTTALVLILLVIALNLGAILLRDHVRKKYISGAFN